jgi:hypothetical protein
MAIPTTRFVREAYEARYDRFNYNGSYAINNDDMCYRDPATGYVYPASNINTTNYTNLTSAYLLQRFGAKYFLGLAGAQKLATDLADLDFPVAARGVLDMVCASGSNFNAGQLVAIATNVGVTALLTDTVVATNDPDLAVGVVVSETGATQYPSGTSLVRCLMGTGFDLWFANGMTGARIGKLTESIAFGSVGGITGSGPYTGTYTFNQKLPAGALVLGYRANVATAFAGSGISAITLAAGYSGHTSAFSADTSQSLFAAGNVASLAAAAGPQVSSETAPSLTFTLTGGNTLSAGSVTVSILYVAPEGP